MPEATCTVCEEKFFYVSEAKSRLDVGKVPQVCNSKMCKTNFKYAVDHTDRNGKRPSFKDIKRW